MAGKQFGSRAAGRSLHSLPLPQRYLNRLCSMKVGFHKIFYLGRFNEAVGCAGYTIIRGTNVALSTGWPGNIAIAWRVQAANSPTAGWNPESKLSEIFYNPQGHEINKNILQFFSGMPFQVDFPMFRSEVFWWTPFGTNLYRTGKPRCTIEAAPPQKDLNTSARLKTQYGLETQASQKKGKA